MFKYRRLISASLVLGFAAVLVVLTACTLDAAPLCPAGGGAGADGPAIGADGDCCLTCSAKAAVVDSPGFSVPAISLLPLVTTGVVPASAVLSTVDRPVAAAGDIPFPPVFLLNAAFLI